VRREKPEVLQAKAREWPAFAQEFQDETDRAAAVLGAAWLDVRLQRLLQNFLVDDPKVIAPLFEALGPLDAFGPRIRLAYSLGLISRMSFDDLVLIKDIRNAFAHNLHGLTFSDPQIARACSRLQTPNKEFAAAHITSKAGPRKLHEIAVAMLANFLDDGAEAALKARCQIKGREEAEARRKGPDNNGMQLTRSAHRKQSRGPRS